MMPPDLTTSNSLLNLCHSVPFISIVFLGLARNSMEAIRHLYYSDVFTGISSVLSILTQITFSDSTQWFGYTHLLRNSASEHVNSVQDFLRRTNNDVLWKSIHIPRPAITWLQLQILSSFLSTVVLKKTQLRNFYPASISVFLRSNIFHHGYP